MVLYLYILQISAAALLSATLAMPIEDGQSLKTSIQPDKFEREQRMYGILDQAEDAEEASEDIKRNVEITDAKVSDMKCL